MDDRDGRSEHCSQSMSRSWLRIARAPLASGSFVAVCLAAKLVAGQTASGAASSAPASSTSPPRTRLSDTAELDQLVELYMAGEYDRCTSELSVLLDPKSRAPFRDAGAIERGRLYFASCSLLAGDRERARAALRAALEANPLMSAPDSLTFPPPVVSLFLEVRDEVEALITKREQEQLAEFRRQAEAAAAAERKKQEKEQLLYKLASEETVVARQSRWLAMLPLGAGQFQNGDTTLGVVFLTSELLLGAALITSAALHADAYATSVLYSQAKQSIPDNVRQTYDVTATLAVASTFALVGVTALGIVEANLKFRPERVLGVRSRPLPPELQSSSRSEPEARALRLVPEVAIHPAGGYLGLRGTF